MNGGSVHTQFGFARHAVLAAVCLTQPAMGATIAYWRFENGVPNATASGASTILDSSGNNLHGTPLGGPIYWSATAPIGAVGLELTPADDRVSIPDYSALALTQSLTIEAYIRIDAYPTNPAALSQIVFRGDYLLGLDPYYLAIHSSGSARFEITNASNSAVSLFTPMALPLHTLMHLAARLDNTTGAMSIFIDGALVAQTTTAIRPYAALSGPNPGLGIGNLPAGGDQAFSGAIDEVRISDVALAPADMLPPVPAPATGVALVLAVLACPRCRQRRCGGSA